MLNCSLLVDSDTTIINSSLYYDLPRPRPRLGEPKLHFKIADGRVLHLLGVMTCEIKVGSTVVEYEIYVAELGKINGVLGSDFLSTVPKIDFGLGALEYQGQEISSQNESQANKASVRATEAFTIKAKTNARFPAEVMNEVGLMRLDTELFWQVAPSFGYTCTVVISELLVKPNTSNLVSMVIVYMFDKDMYIRKGTCLASVSPVKAIDSLKSTDEGHLMQA